VARHLERCISPLRTFGRQNTALCFRSTQPAAIELAGSEQAADAEYRYVVEFLPGQDARLQLQGWRRLPGADSWTPRCGPMELAEFIKRSLPGGLDV
jgi:hypothetical protein